MPYAPAAIPANQPASRSIANNVSSKGFSMPAVAPLQKTNTALNNSPVLQRVVIYSVTHDDYKVSVDYSPVATNYLVKKGEGKPETLSAEEMKEKYADLWALVDHKAVEQKITIKKQRTTAADWIKEKDTANIKWPYYTAPGLDAIHILLKSIDFERTLEPPSKEKNRRARWRKRIDRMEAQLLVIAEANCFYEELITCLEDDVKEIVAATPPPPGRGLKANYSEPKAKDIWKSYTPYIALQPDSITDKVHDLVMALTKKPGGGGSAAPVEDSPLGAQQWRAIRKKLLQRAPAAGAGALTYAITGDGKIAGIGKSGWDWQTYFSISKGVINTEEPALEGFAATLSKIEKVESLGRSILACGEVSAATNALLNGVVADVDNLLFATSEQQSKQKGAPPVKRLLKRCEHCDQWAKTAYKEPV